MKIKGGVDKVGCDKPHALGAARLGAVLCSGSQDGLLRGNGGWLTMRFFSVTVWEHE